MMGRTAGEEGIMVPDPEVSGRHCVIEAAGRVGGTEQWTLRDLGSTNGTSLARLDPRGQPQAGDGGQAHRLCQGDRVRLGSQVEFVVELREAAAAELEGTDHAATLVRDFGACADANRHGMARGGRKSISTGKCEMEDFVVCLAPVAVGPGAVTVAVFCVFDGESSRQFSFPASNERAGATCV